MILDASVIVAIILKEPGWEKLLTAMESSPVLAIGAPSLAEAAIVLTARLSRDSRPLLALTLQEFRIDVIPFGEIHWREAAGAYLRFGKGRHQANLNFGDCLTYATASLARQPLLCTGRDFQRTDLDLAR